MKETAKRPRLKNLDDLFMLTDGMDQFQENPAPTLAQDRQFIIIDTDRLTPFPGHPFHLYAGERLEDMVESIRKNGVLVPIIARQKDGGIEILSGHNRVNAAKRAGLNMVPAIVLKEVSDDDAWVYVIETNLMQRSFADMSHSEKAAVIAIQHSKMFSQGKRNDILRELQSLENPHDSRENGTSVAISQKLGTRESIAQEYGLHPYRIAQYLRIHLLAKSLKLRLDNNGFAVTTAVSLSFLKEAEQKLLDKCLELNGFAVDMKKAGLLRADSKKGKLDEERIYLILSGEVGQKPKPNRTPTVKIRKPVYTKYFRPGQPEKEVQDIVEKALDLYFSQEAKDEAVTSS